MLSEKHNMIVRQENFQKHSHCFVEISTFFEIIIQKTIVCGTKFLKIGVDKTF